MSENHSPVLKTSGRTAKAWLSVASLVLAALACNQPGSAPVPSASPAGPSPAATQAANPSPAATLASLSPTETQMPATSEPDASPAPTDLPIPTQTPLPGPTQEPSPTAFDPLAVPLAVVLVPAGDVLNVRREPGPSSPLLAQFPPNESGFFRTGDEKLVGDQRWVQLRLLSGQRGWVNGMYLTEYTPRERFCADPQVITLLDRFAEAVRSADGSRLSALVSPSHGLSVNYFREGQRINYSPDELLFVFESDFETAWGIQPASGEPIKGSFRDVVLPNLDQVLGGEYQTACNEIVMGGSNYNYEWPSEYSSINYYSVFKPGTPGVDLDWRTWLVGVEYSRGRPYLFSLEHLFWEP